MTERVPAPHFPSQELSDAKPVRSYAGKRTARMHIPKQVNEDPELCREIKARADRQMRPIGLEIIHLLTVGLSNDPEQTVFEYFLGGAQSRTAARKNSRRAKNVQALLDRVVRERVDKVLREKGHRKPRQSSKISGTG